MIRTSVLALLGLAVPWVKAVDVFAHVMVTMTYGYTTTTWKNDMLAARQMGVDGFSLNWTPPHCDSAYDLSWFMEQIDNAYTAAAELNFKLYHSLDMATQDCNEPFSQSFLQEQLAKHAGNSATYRWNSNILVRVEILPRDVTSHLPGSF